MMNIEKMTKEELRSLLKTKDAEHEELERQLSRALKKEEEEEEYLCRLVYQIEEERNESSPEERKLLGIIDDRQDILQGISRDRSEFPDEYRRAINNAHKKIDFDIEDIERQIRLLEEKIQQSVKVSKGN